MEVNDELVSILLLTTGYGWAGISPSKLEVNLAAVPLDQYSYSNLNSSGLVDGCATTTSIRACYQNILSNYASQGVTGIRFQFGLGGGGGSTAFYPNPQTGVLTPSVNPPWLTNLQSFFSDVHAAGIYNITPTPAMDGWTATPTQVTVSRSGSCPGPTNNPNNPQDVLYFYPWLPYGTVYTETSTDPPAFAYYPDGQNQNGCYSASPSNPTFSPGNQPYWGWQPVFTLFGDVFAAARAAGLTIEEFDLSNEVDLWDFPVQARIIYDNITDTAVFSSIGSLLISNGFSSAAVTTSVSAGSPNEAGPYPSDCESLYGDSAMLLHLSELLAAVTANDFGQTSGSVSSADDGPPPNGGGGMWCYNPSPPYGPVNGNGQACGAQGSSGWAQCVTYGMISTPVPQAVPSVLDIHSTPSCVLSAPGVCDRTNSTVAIAQAKTFFSDFWALMSYRQVTSATAMFGELPNNQPDDCDSESPLDATWSVAGYLQSSLYSNAGSHTVLRPWENSVGSCVPGPGVYQIPASIGAPSGPYAR